MTKAGLKIGDIDIAGRVLIAPMTGVSDLPFRHMAAKLGAPYAATEMVACEDLFKQRPDVVRKAELGAHDGLKIVQLVGRDPAHIARGASRPATASGYSYPQSRVHLDSHNTFRGIRVDERH